MKTMTPEQKQITIAEWEGWRIEQDCHPGAKFVFHKPGGGKWLADYIDGQLPPYLTSRDAICGAVAKLDEAGLAQFANHLQEICRHYCVGVVPDYHRNLASLTRLILATPAQMADALLLTLGYEI